MARPRRELSLFDSTSLIVGIILGAGIYEMAPAIAHSAGSAWGFLGLWAAGGLLSLCGALGYAELAAAWPRQGGDYVYLGRAYGSWAGFLFGWVQLAVVRPGDIAVMAFIFATYAGRLWDPLPGEGFFNTRIVYAAGAVLLLTAINLLGVRQGKGTQNLLTAVKILGLLAVVAAALAAPAPGPAAPTGTPVPLEVALVFVLFCFGGWNEMAYVAAEVRRPARNILRALVIGTVAVTALYLLAAGSFLLALGYPGVAASEAVAADTVGVLLPRVGAKLVAALICLSALGAVNGLIFAGARISYALGTDHRLFRFLGGWSARGSAPVPALLVQAALALLLVVGLREVVPALIYVAAPVYTFYLATTLAVMVLRKREPAAPRPYRVTGYPLPPLLFAGTCAFLIYKSVAYKPAVAAAALGLLLLGLPLHRWSRSGRGGRG